MTPAGSCSSALQEESELMDLEIRFYINCGKGETKSLLRFSFRFWAWALEEEQRGYKL